MFIDRSRRNPARDGERMDQYIRRLERAVEQGDVAAEDELARARQRMAPLDMGALQIAALNEWVELAHRRCGVPPVAGRDSTLRLARSLLVLAGGHVSRRGRAYARWWSISWHRMAQDRRVPFVAIVGKDELVVIGLRLGASARAMVRMGARTLGASEVELAWPGGVHNDWMDDRHVQAFVPVRTPVQGLATPGIEWIGMDRIRVPRTLALAWADWRYLSDLDPSGARRSRR